MVGIFRGDEVTTQIEASLQVTRFFGEYVPMTHLPVGDFKAPPSLRNGFIISCPLRLARG
jgi:hypothetical protein